MGKIYMPQNMINSNWGYELNADDNYFVVHTYNNCYNNYNTQYCDCYKIYPTMDYITTNAFACYRGNYASINYNDLTSDFWYRIDIDKSLIIFTILFIFGILIPYKIISRLFGRWLKV